MPSLYYQDRLRDGYLMWAISHLPKRQKIWESGIINLVLKKRAEAGLNGQVSLMAGLREKYNGDVQFNYRKGKVNMFAGLTGTSYNTRLTFSAIYNGPSITLQGTQKEIYMFNVGVRQEMLKRKASLALSVRDLFKTFVIENEIRGEDYLTVTSIHPETQVVTLTFTYNFNNYRQRTQEENMDLNFIRANNGDICLPVT